MIDERARRRPTFQPGKSVRLADGQVWSLPRLAREHADPDLNEMIAALCEAEDEAERLRGELALTIMLLSRNYDLTPESFPQILGYRAGDPAQAEMRRVVHQMIVEAMDETRLDASPATLPRSSKTRSARWWWPSQNPVASQRPRWGWSLRSH